MADDDQGEPLTPEELFAACEEALADYEEDRPMLLKLAADPATPQAAVRILVETGRITESEAESLEFPPELAAVILLRAMDAAIENETRAQKRAARDRRKREKQKRRRKR